VARSLTVPRPPKQIVEGEPVCTVHAEGFDTTSAKGQLMMRLASQRESLGFEFEVA